MKTSLATVPGLIAVNTAQSDKTIPPNRMRISFAKLEIQEYGLNDINPESEFSILAGLADGNRTVAKLLLALHDHLTMNLEVIKRLSK